MRNDNKTHPKKEYHRSPTQYRPPKGVTRQRHKCVKESAQNQKGNNAKDVKFKLQFHIYLITVPVLPV